MAKVDNNILSTVFRTGLTLIWLLTACLPAGAQVTQNRNGGQVELNGDAVEYDREKNRVIVEGDVVIKYRGTTLKCDRAEYDQNTQTAVATGNVRLLTEQGEVWGDDLTFNYATMTGDFKSARLLADPYYGGGEQVEMVSEDKLVMTNGYVTTSDYDKPEWRIQSKKIDIYPGDKLVAHGNRLKIGEIPLMFLPRYWHRLDDTKPKLILTPGYDSDWGMFLLTQYRFYTSKYVKGVLRLDYRELLDVASGFDIDYKTPGYGAGLLKAYYTNERKIDADRIWDDRRTPTPETERYKVEWRHKWILDERTTAIAQYYKLSDRNFLKDYFEREFEEDSFPDTFFLLTHTLPKGTLSLRSDVRVNRFVSDVERLPELRYDLNNTEIGDTGFYFRNITTFSYLTEKSASPRTFQESTNRYDTDYEISYPAKVGVVEVRPFIGGRNTFYTRTLDPDKDNEMREVYRAGASLSTKFYKIYDLETDALGLDITRLRHIVTPTVSYTYTTDPSVTPGELNQFDGVDNIRRQHTIHLGLENKLQTKRGDKTVELLRAVFGVDYRLRQDFRDSGFDIVTADIDFRPTKWMTLYFDSKYDTREDYLETANTDLFFSGGSKWSLGLGHRYTRDTDDQITTQLKYLFNQKWAFRGISRVDVDNGDLEAQEYILTRDLHSWEMDLQVNESDGDGTQVLMLFRLKAFPELGFDFGTTFERKRSGSDAGDN
ncbi:MAG: LPS assembly protein LptD [Candidatus Omnitrophica bacterium]|nr:LPS assembly protein LptD [Candidatus Omnitrophota bacterium]